MSDDAISVLRDQVNDLKRRNSELASNYERVKKSRDNFKREVQDLSGQIGELQEVINSYPTIEELEILTNTIQEWEPIIKDQEDKDNNFNLLIEERDNLQSDLDALKEAYNNLHSESEVIRAKLALPFDEANERLSQTQKELMRIKHEQAWNRELADLKDEKGNPVSLQTKVGISKVWDEIKYVPEGELPDSTTVLNRLQEAQREVPYLFKVADTAPHTPNGEITPRPRENKPPGPGIPRGNPGEESGVLRVSAKEMFGGKKVMSSQDQQEYLTAFKSGKLKVN